MVIWRPSSRGSDFDLGDRSGLFLDLVEEPYAELLVGHLAAAEAQRHLDLVAFLEEAADRFHLHLVVVGVDVRPHLDFLDFDRLLLLARLGGLLLALIFEAAVVENFGDRRDRIGGDFDEVEPGGAGDLERLGDGGGTVIGVPPDRSTGPGGRRFPH